MSWVRGVHRAAVAAVVCALAGAATGQVVYAPVIAPGQSAPGTSLMFGVPQNPTCAAPRRTAMYSILTGPGANPGFNDRGVWEGDRFGLSLRGVVGGAIGGGGANFSIIEGATLTQNRSGAVVFAANVNSSPLDDRGVFYALGGVAAFAVREGSLAPDCGGAVFGSMLTQFPNEIALNDGGRIGFVGPITGAGVTGTNNRAVFTGNASLGAYSLVARREDPAPDTGGALLNFFSSPAITTNGTVAFFATLSNIPVNGPNSGLFLRTSGGPLTAALLQGQPAPGLPSGATFTNIGTTVPPAINDAGQVLITGFASNSGSFIWGVWRGAPGALSLVARQNDAAPGAGPAAQFQNFSTSMLTRNGTALISGNVMNGVSSTGLWTAIPGQAIRKVVLAGEPAEGLAPGVVYLGFTNSQTGNLPAYTINNRGETMFIASLNYVVNGTPALGIFAGRAGRLHKVVASGDVLEVAPGDFRTVNSVFAFTGSGPDTGRQTSINDRGEVAFSCSLVGGGGATFIARLPHPCPGDATADDMIGFADLNVVLAAYNTVEGAPGFDDAADFDQDGDVDFADLNQVLAGFNGGCL